MAANGLANEVGSRVSYPGDEHGQDRPGQADLVGG